MTHGHFIEKCVHGTVGSQCRCMDPNKEVRIIPCPSHCKGEKLTSSNTQGVLTGWLCPVCGEVNGPFQTGCINGPHALTVTRTSTGSDSR